MSTKSKTRHENTRTSFLFFFYFEEGFMIRIVTEAKICRQLSKEAIIIFK